MRARPRTLGPTEQGQLLTGGELPSGETGLLGGTLVGPPEWGVGDGESLVAAQETYGVLGVLEHDTTVGQPATYQFQGRRSCRISGPVAPGNRLSLDPASPGHLMHRTDGEGQVLAIAQESAFSPGSLALCLLVGFPLVPPDASGVP